MNKKLIGIVATATAALLLLSGCAQGEGSALAGKPTQKASVGFSAEVLNIDFATYNPLSLIIKDKGWIEKKLGAKVKVNWIQSTGSNTANQALRAGVVDVGSTAGSAALLARANGSPIKAIDVFSQPDWSAILVPVGSPITSVKHKWSVTAAEKAGLVTYLRALPPRGFSGAN